MAIIVQKFGGTSVADVERIRNVAQHVKREVDAGNQVAVVVSAMAGETNRLVGFCNEFTVRDESEYDTVVSTGEQVTVGLLALALQEIGIKARSWLGWQLGIRTDSTHSKARIEGINAEVILEGFTRGEVAVIPGFQGVTDEGRISTLGRGGSDTSAVAVAAALKAERCDIYTDVDGVYTTDPRIVPEARKLQKVGYEEMLEMASLGAKVLQTRSVELAMKENVRLQVLSSFQDTPGTLLVNEEEIMERRKVTGIAYSKNEAKVTLINVENTPGVAAKIFSPLADSEINVDMIVQNVSEDGLKTNVTFTVPKTDLQKALEALDAAQKKGELVYGKLLSDSNVAKVSVIGIGMQSHAGIAQTMFSTLASKGINILVITTSEIKISVLIDEESSDDAVRMLHAAYELDKKPKRVE
ncbi:MAG: aspartate kinase [Alphaproteobacteria bacterium CG11_big_fil_rev_8_21_14_0_20_44_7]|nr:MAG: aspartate kinase [Alphaproteobacteria bacterium CG11_big_fil_rev_8_21_14_0_20_44_7]